MKTKGCPDWFAVCSPNQEDTALHETALGLLVWGVRRLVCLPAHLMHFARGEVRGEVGCCPYYKWQVTSIRLHRILCNSNYFPQGSSRYTSYP